jgi:hypothetical protein
LAGSRDLYTGFFLAFTGNDWQRIFHHLYRYYVILPADIDEGGFFQFTVGSRRNPEHVAFINKELYFL